MSPSSNTGSGQGSAAGSLTSRQLAVLALLAWGVEPKVAARRLEVSVSGLHTSLRQAVVKLGVRNKVEAWRRLGWLELPE